MEAKLQQQFELLEQRRKELLSYVSSYSDKELNTSPEIGKWSPNQLILHLLLAEELSYKSIKTRIITTSNFEKSGINHVARVILLRIFLRSSKKYKAPAEVGDLPHTSDLNQLIDRWDVARLNLKNLLETLPQHLHNKYIFKHPIVGKMTIYGALLFMTEHLRRHTKQLIQQLKNK